MQASIPAPPTSPPTPTHTHTPLSIPLHLSWIHPPAFVTHIKQYEAHNVSNENLEDDTWNEFVITNYLLLYVYCMNLPMTSICCNYPLTSNQCKPTSMY